MFGQIIESIRLEAVSKKHRQVRGLSKKTGLLPQTSPGGVSGHRSSGDKDLDRQVRNNYSKFTADAATAPNRSRSDDNEPGRRALRKLRDSAKKHGTDSSSQNPKTIRKRERKAAAAKRRPMPLPK